MDRRSSGRCALTVPAEPGTSAGRAVLLWRAAAPLAPLLAPRGIPAHPRLAHCALAAWFPAPAGLGRKGIVGVGKAEAPRAPANNPASVRRRLASAIQALFKSSNRMASMVKALREALASDAVSFVGPIARRVNVAASSAWVPRLFAVFADCATLFDADVVHAATLLRAADTSVAFFALKAFIAGTVRGDAHGTVRRRRADLPVPTAFAVAAHILRTALVTATDRCPFAPVAAASPLHAGLRRVAAAVVRLLFLFRPADRAAARLAANGVGKIRISVEQDLNKAISAAKVGPHFIGAIRLALAANATRRLRRARAALAAAALAAFLAFLALADLHAAQTIASAAVGVALAPGVGAFAGGGGLFGVRGEDDAAAEAGGERGQRLAAGAAPPAARQGIEALRVHHALLWTVRDRVRRCLGIGGRRCGPS